MSADAHPFDSAIALTPDGAGQWCGHTSAAYANMVGPFGGIMAAQALNAVMQHPGRLGEPISFTVNFCAALADGAFTVQVRPARTNRSTQHWLLEFLQEGKTVLTASAVTALRRDTWGLSEAHMPSVAAPADLAQANTGGRLPWLNCYELRFVHGSFPPAFDGEDAGDSLTQIWMRDAPRRPLDFASLTALADVFFPRILRRRARPTPIGTVSMTVYFHVDGKALRDTGTGHVLGQARAQAMHRGFFDQTVQLWNESGTLLATSHQIVYYKE